MIAWLYGNVCLILNSKLSTIRRLIIYLSFAFFSLSCGPEPVIPSVLGSYVPEMFELRGYGQLPYNIYFPKDYDGRKEYPLIFFLHGGGGRGIDNIKQLKHVAPLLASKESQEKYPSILVFPQCPVNDYWASVDINNNQWTYSEDNRSTAAGLKAEKLLDYIVDTYQVDKKRVYINGLSMGGFGTYSILSRMPEKVSAAIAISGGTNPKNAEQFKNVPLMIFHGENDQVVPVSQSRLLAKKLDSLSAPYEFTLYPNLGHAIWDKVYEDAGTLEWLFSQKKS